LVGLPVQNTDRLQIFTGVGGGGRGPLFPQIFTGVGKRGAWPPCFRRCSLPMSGFQGHVRLQWYQALVPGTQLQPTRSKLQSWQRHALARVGCSRRPLASLRAHSCGYIEWRGSRWGSPQEVCRWWWVEHEFATTLEGLSRCGM
jgi:hypothetical protein